MPPCLSALMVRGPPRPLSPGAQHRRLKNRIPSAEKTLTCHKKHDLGRLGHRMQGVSIAIVALVSQTSMIPTSGVGTPPLGTNRASLSLRTHGARSATTALSEGATPTPEDPFPSAAKTLHASQKARSGQAWMPNARSQCCGCRARKPDVHDLYIGCRHATFGDKPCLLVSPHSWCAVRHDRSLRGCNTDA